MADDEGWTEFMAAAEAAVTAETKHKRGTQGFLKAWLTRVVTQVARDTRQVDKFARDNGCTRGKGQRYSVFARYLVALLWDWDGIGITRTRELFDLCLSRTRHGDMTTLQRKVLGVATCDARREAEDRQQQREGEAEHKGE